MAPIETAYYDLLEVSPDATADELAKAYRQRALKLHPDKGGDEDQFKAMKSAYDVLKDPQKRQWYDSHGAAIVRAMDGEVLEPEVMLEVVLSVTRSASRMVLFSLPIIAVVLLFPAVALSLKWDHRIALNWTLVFIPLWVVQLIVLLLLLKLRSVMSMAGDLEADEEERERVVAEDRRRHVTKIFTMCACIVALLIVQEGFVAAKLQGDLRTPWFIVLIPYLVFESLIFYLRIRMLVGTMTGSMIAIVATLVMTVSWGILRLLTVGLLAAKGDKQLQCSWTLCLIPMMFGATCKLLWTCRNTRRRPDPDDETADGPTFVAACFSIALWLSMLLLGAGKLDGREYSAFLVFLPFFLLVAQLLCCCTCLACCGPVVLGAFLKQEQEKARQRPQGDEAQNLNRASNGTSRQDYNTLP